MQNTNLFNAVYIHSSFFLFFLRPDGQTSGATDLQADRSDEANSRFSQFCGRA